mmetsp:Transcript_144485/g.402525  ORF Transcript_144485/g.402525 Transcript_144485/m.402525 type:complete len:237 (+) Transcript_144485:2200-2910(+)
MAVVLRQTRRAPRYPLAALCQQLVLFALLKTKASTVKKASQFLLQPIAVAACLLAPVPLESLVVHCAAITVRPQQVRHLCAVLPHHCIRSAADHASQSTSVNLPIRSVSLEHQGQTSLRICRKLLRTKHRASSEDWWQLLLWLLAVMKLQQDALLILGYDCRLVPGLNHLGLVGEGQVAPHPLRGLDARVEHVVDAKPTSRVLRVFELLILVIDAHTGEERPLGDCLAPLPLRTLL